MERNANFKPRLFFSFSSKRSSVFWVTKYTPAFIARPARTSFIDSVFPCATCKKLHASSKSTILKMLRSVWIKSKAKVLMTISIATDKSSIVVYSSKEVSLSGSTKSATCIMFSCFSKLIDCST
ncbi:Uncharacterised protein [Streptococcus pneumoniae]|nr:Uncharacterised protein [Streptococcus pneumoniae]